MERKKLKDEQPSCSCQPRSPPPTITNIEKIKVTKIKDTLQLGTVVTLNGPVMIKGVTIQELLSIDESLSEKCGIKVSSIQAKGAKNQKNCEKLKKKFVSTCSVTKCLVFIFFFFLIQGIILFFLAKSKIVTHTGICVQKINDMNSKLPHHHRRFFWNKDHNCVYSSYINIKTKLKFSIVQPLKWSCLLELRTLEVRKDPIPGNCVFDDLYYINGETNIMLYYHYVISYYGEIFEERPMNCGFEKKEEEFLKENHSAVIVVGIPYCFHVNRNKSLRLHQAISNLTDSLLKTGILSINFTLEFPDVCKTTTFVQDMLLQNQGINYSFNNKDVFNSTKLSQEFIKTLLFQVTNHYREPMSFLYSLFAFNNISNFKTEDCDKIYQNTIQKFKMYNSDSEKHPHYLFVTLSDIYINKSNICSTKRLNYYIKFQEYLINYEFPSNYSQYIDGDSFIIDIAIHFECSDCDDNYFFVYQDSVRKSLRIIIDDLERSLGKSLNNFLILFFKEESRADTILWDLYSYLGIHPSVQKNSVFPDVGLDDCYHKYLMHHCTNSTELKEDYWDYEYIEESETGFHIEGGW